MKASLHIFSKILLLTGFALVGISNSSANESFQIKAPKKWKVVEGLFGMPYSILSPNLNEQGRAVLTVNPVAHKDFPIKFFKKHDFYSSYKAQKAEWAKNSDNEIFRFFEEADPKYSSWVLGGGWGGGGGGGWHSTGPSTNTGGFMGPLRSFMQQPMHAAQLSSPHGTKGNICHHHVMFLVTGSEPVDVFLHAHYVDIVHTPAMDMLDDSLPKWAKGANWAHFVSAVKASRA